MLLKENQVNKEFKHNRKYFKNQYLGGTFPTTVQVVLIRL